MVKVKEEIPTTVFRSRAITRELSPGRRVSDVGEITIPDVSGTNETVPVSLPTFVTW
jgi:hypothetical protein